ncbi:hypothetical protein DPX16_1815 [Anabarilius grahami]|uniref:Uncharacterized protein n=1 Tax=Anabarilius grahami TaxID=495550 RepID=A0A3N0Y7V5_ANAGA|nr:hypothetical protein DPX16_1815 [Anabarilius grahami]
MDQTRPRAGLETRPRAGLETRPRAGLETRPRAGLETRCPAFGVYASCPKLFLGRLVGPYAYVYGSCPCRQNQQQMYRYASARGSYHTIREGRKVRPRIDLCSWVRGSPPNVRWESFRGSGDDFTSLLADPWLKPSLPGRSSPGKKLSPPSKRLPQRTAELAGRRKRQSPRRLPSRAARFRPPIRAISRGLSPL